MGSASATAQVPAAMPVTGCLMVQAAARESLEVLRLADRPGSGVVFTGAGAIEAVHAARRQGYARPMLTDRRRYAGASRIRGTVAVTQSWLTGQRDAGIAPVLTDSGYIGDGDLEALRAVLRNAADAGPDVTAVLPLHPHWLRQDRERLIAEVLVHGLPVALVLEHAGDALATPRAAGGLIALLRAAPSLAVLAAGVGALGALALGAQWAAVGVRRSLRHLLPATSEEKPAARRSRWQAARPEIIAAPVLSLATVAMVVHAYEATPDNAAWACHCASCRGRTPDWLSSASVFDANAHTFDVLLGAADRLRGRDGPAREQAWRTMCREALDRYGELGLAALGWEPPRLMSAWAGAPASEYPADRLRRSGRATTSAANPRLRSAG